jgi:hypothetical protein
LVHGERVVVGGQEVNELPRGMTARAIAGDPVKYPGSLADALKQSRIGKQFEVTRDAWLALTQHADEFGDRQFALAQEGQHA